MLETNPNVCVRPAAASDAEALAGIFEQSWRQAYSGIIPHNFLSDTIKHHGKRWWERALAAGGSHLVLEVLGEPAGYASFGKARSQGREEGEIYELYLAPLYQGLGFGEYLFEGCRANLDDRRLRGLVVWVLRDNRGARTFYAHRGGLAMHRRIDLTTGVPLEKLGYVWG